MTSASFKQRRPEGPFDAIVIGSGVGGLAAAAALARYGQRRVLVLEQHYRIGGYTHTFTRAGYEWDVGVHYVGDVGPRQRAGRLFAALTDGSLSWTPLPEVQDRALVGARGVDLVRGREAFIDRLAQAFPGTRGILTRYLDLCRACDRAVQLGYLERAVPGALTALVGPRHRRAGAEWALKTTRDVLLELTRDEDLIAVLTAQFGNYGLAPGQSSFAAHAANVMHYLEGAWYPVGGSASIARAFVPVIAAAGGAVFHRASVAGVMVDEGRAVGVRMADGFELRAPIIVSDAGALNTFQRLLPPALVPADLSARLDAVGSSVSCLCLYLGFRESDAALGLDGTNLWMTPGGSHDDNIAAFLADESRPLPVVYASFPSAKDPSWPARYPGRATVELITLCPWSRVERWQSGPRRARDPEYLGFKARMTERLLDTLFRVRPQLAGKVDHAELSTPLTARHFAAHPRGELYGLDHGPMRYALELPARTFLPGLFLTGADVCSGGVVGALMGGVFSAGAILGDAFLERLLSGGR